MFLRSHDLLIMIFVTQKGTFIQASEVQKMDLENFVIFLESDHSLRSTCTNHSHTQNPNGVTVQT